MKALCVLGRTVTYSVKEQACIVDNPAMTGSSKPMQWDIFCKVIDNFGDTGVCWRLVADLASRGHAVRLWVDDASALSWMAPGGQQNVEVLTWKPALEPQDLAKLDSHPCNVIVEAFGCDVAPEFIAACAENMRARGQFDLQPLWINLEYLSAEPYVERCHGLPSPVQTGPARGWTKWFFYPGFTSQTGGLLREPGLGDALNAFGRDSWLAGLGLSSSELQGKKLISLFCYEPPLLAGLIQNLIANGLDGQPVQLLVAAGRPQKAVRDVIEAVSDAALVAASDAPQGPPAKNIDEIGCKPIHCMHGMLSILFLPLLSQTGFDRLLWSCDLNFVRGEDSVVRAIWAGKPLVWQIYPQDDNVHRAKLDAFLDAMNAPETSRSFHRAWNAPAEAGSESQEWNPSPAPAAGLEIELDAWAASTVAMRSRLMLQDDLCTQLLNFAQKKR